MAGVKPEEAKQFYEEDEDLQKVFAILDAAKREGRLQRTAPPARRPPRSRRTPLIRELPRFQFRDRLVDILRHLAAAIERSGSHKRVG